jgi:hypothetical protein
MSEVQGKLLAIWSDILGKPEIRATDDFYALGGTSLRLIRMMGRIRAEFGVSLFYGDLMESVTIESLTLMLDKEAGTRPKW